MTVRYMERPPSPVLAAAVDCYWSASGSVPEAGRMRNRVLPDGCMDFIFNLGDPPHPSAGITAPLRSYLVGPMREAMVVTHSGQVDLFGVRFRPGGAIRFLRIAASDLTGLTVELGSFWRDAGSMTDALAEVASDGPSLPEPGSGTGDPAVDPAWMPGSEAATAGAMRRRLDMRAAMIESRLLRHPEIGTSADPALDAAARMIWASRGAVSVSSIGRHLGMAPRTLERRFRSAVGLTPKAACRVARVQAAAWLLRSPEGSSLARVAIMAGFHDQAHFTRDFGQLAGVTPAGFLREQRDGFVQDDAGSPG